MPPTKNELISLVSSTANQFGIDPPLALALTEQESGFDPNAISPTGVEGLLQVTKATGVRYGQDPNNRRDPATSARAGLAYFADLLKDARGNVRQALARYNGGSDPNYAENVLRHYPKFSGGAEAQVAEYTAATSPIRVRLRESAAKKDVRLPVIDEGLRILGKTRETAGLDFDDPAQVQQFYESVMDHAFQLKPDLDLSGGIPAALNVLRGAPVLGGPTTATAEPTPPEAPSTFAKIRQDVAKAFTSKIGDTGIQTIRGILLDPILEFGAALDDVGKLGTVIGDSLMSLTGLDPTRGAREELILPPELRYGGARRTGARDAQKALDDFLGAPETGTSGVFRAMAGFIAPFIGLSKALRVPGTVNQAAELTAGKLAQEGVAAATTGLIVDTTFVDPNTPAVADLIDDFARQLSPDDPNRIRSVITRYIAGEIDDPELRASIGGRVTQGISGIPAGVLLDTFMGSVRLLRQGHRVSKALKEEQAILGAQAGRDTERAAAQAEADRVATRQARQADPNRAGTEILIEKRGPSAEEVQAYREKAAAQRKALLEDEAPATTRPEPPRSEGTVIEPPPEGATADEVAAYQVRVQEQRAALRAEAEAEAEATRIAQVETSPQGKGKGRGRKKVEPEPSSTVSGPPPAMARWLDTLLDEVESTPVPPKGRRSRAPKPPEQGTLPPDVAIEQADAFVKAADDSATPVGKATKRLKDALGDTPAKAVLATMFRGGLGGLVADSLLTESEAEAADGTDSGTSNSGLRKAAVILMGAGLASLGLRGTVRALRPLVERIDPGYTSRVRDVNIGPALRRRVEGRPLVEAIPPKANVRPRDRYTVSGVGDLTAQLDGIQFREDLTDAIQHTTRLVSPSTTHAAGVNLADPVAIAGKTGILLRTAQRLNLADPAVKARTGALVTLSHLGQEEAKRLATEVYRGADAETTRRFLRTWSLLGDIANAADPDSPLYGRGLEMFRLADDGSIHSGRFEGEAAGQILTTGKTPQQLAFDVLRLSGPQVSDAARRAVNPTVGGAINEAIYSSMLSRPRTGVKATVSNIGMAYLNAYEHLAGPILQRITGQSLPGGYISEEGLEMFKELFRSTGDALRLGIKTQIMGDASFVESGTSQGGSAFRTPQFNRYAFGVDNPILGQVIDTAGEMMRAVGGRPTIAADEVGSFLVERSELKAYAIRTARAEGISDPSQLAARELEILNDVPAQAAADIKYQKRNLTQMRDLFDERGGFRLLREWAGDLQRKAGQSPFLRLQVPFARAMTNMLTNGLERTPIVNLISGSFRAELQSPDPIIRSDAFGRLATSVSAGLFGSALVGGGMLVGKITNDPELRKNLDAAGIQENSIKLPGYGWVPLDPGEPLGLVLTGVANMASFARDDVTPAEAGWAEAVTTSFAKLFADNYFLGVFGNLIDMFEEGTFSRQAKKFGFMEAGVQTLDQLLFRAFAPPGLLQDMQKLMEPDKKVYDTFLQELRNRTPGAEHAFGAGVPETDILGDKRFVAGGWGGDTLNNAARFVFPNVPTVRPDDPLRMALLDKGVILRDPPAIMSMQGVQVPLYPTEVQRLRELMASEGALRKQLTTLVNHPLWPQLTGKPDGEAQLQVSNIVEAFGTRARLQLYRENQEVRERVAAKLAATRRLPGGPQ